MRKKIVFLLAIIFTCIFSARAEEITLTVDEAVALSLRNNRDVLLKAEDLKKAKAEINQAIADIYPTFDFTASRTYARGQYAKDLGASTTQMTLKQYLYKGGEARNTIKKNEYEFAVAQAILDKTKSDTVFSVKQAFYAFCLAEKYSSLNRGILDNSKARLKYMQARYQNGEASESEILKIKESVANVEEAYILSLSQLESAQGSLRNLLYLDEPLRIKPEFEFTYTPLDIAYEESFLRALKNNPRIKQYEEQAKADQKAIEVAKAGSRPDIYASWDYYSRSTTSLTFSPGKGWQDYNIVGVTFSWPIFDGWAAKAKVEQAVIDLRQTQLTKEKTAKDIALELKNAYLEFKDALAKLRGSAFEMLRYEDNFNLISQRYKKGLNSSLDLDDASLSIKVAQFNKAQGAYDYLVAAAKFYKAMGESPPFL